MLLETFYTFDNRRYHFSREQGSRFAKEIAGDFNPIHDTDSKRFCVPGDLLFSLVLARFGVSQRMHFNFAGMVGDGVELDLVETAPDTLVLTDGNGKTYLSVEHSGETSRAPELIEPLTRSYVAFSGQTFPHILVPLMERNAVMINPERPLVIYESMSIELDRLDVCDPHLELTDSHLKAEGKRGEVRLEFCLKSGDEVIGRGQKSMVLSGLRAYDPDKISALVDDYAARKDGYGS